MNFYENQLFHIYNQGNNHRQIFFNDENYKYFLWRMRGYLPLFGDFVSYCLMPNHFHWQFYVRRLSVKREKFWNWVDHVEYHRRVWKYKQKAEPVKHQSRRQKNSKEVSLNEAIAFMEMSYTRSINKQQGWTGSLFRNKCKAKDGWIDEFITLRKPNGQLDSRFRVGTGYGHHCFKYIHQNPEDANLVTKATCWLYSSAKDYAGLRNGTLCNLALGRALITSL